MFPVFDCQKVNCHVNFFLNFHSRFRNRLQHHLKADINHNNHNYTFDLEHSRCMNLYPDIYNTLDRLGMGCHGMSNVSEAESGGRKYKLCRHMIHLGVFPQ